jgi:hypothetical protein
VLEVDINEVLVRAGYPPLIAGYRLPEERDEEPGTEQDLLIDDPRVRFFASKAGALSDRK